MLQNIAFTEAYPQDTAFLSHPEKTVCFSGHRPDAFSEESVFGFSSTALLKTMLAGCIEIAIQDGYRYFVDGLAEGVDMWAADYLLYRKAHGTTPLHLIGVEPCEGYLANRRSGIVEMMAYVEQVDALGTIPMHGQYGFLRRNDYMLEHSSRLICIIQKTKGGTAYTLKEAQKKHLEVHCIASGNEKLLPTLALHFLQQGEEDVPQTAAERYAYYQAHPEMLSVCQSLLEAYARW